ncbi:cytochrome C [Oryzomonas japonica]|uniref:Cytochrome C n=1 Tax=Oryzomonas japonica TaxID=2603858 RepID=A0A7J4ZSH1_9BACT|nr:cytochrome C [Oryzomonas japonica]KAB0666179.1 cytochrome C [Oryzomonas japonica]
MRKLIILVTLFTLVIAAVADARIRVKGRGDRMNFDPDSIPANYRASFDLMSRKCIKCHTMERTVIAVQTGRAPITGQPFDRQAVKAYGIKMLRKPNSNMNKQEIREVVILLNYLLDENAR